MYRELLQTIGDRSVVVDLCVPNRLMYSLKEMGVTVRRPQVREDEDIYLTLGPGEAVLTKDKMFAKYLGPHGVLVLPHGGEYYRSRRYQRPKYLIGKIPKKKVMARRVREGMIALFG